VSRDPAQFSRAKNLAVCERARKTRQLAISPLATTTVGWVPDRTPEAEASAADSERKRKVVRAGCRLTIELKGKRSAKDTRVFHPGSGGSKEGFQPYCEVAFLSGTGAWSDSMKISLSLLEQRQVISNLVCAVTSSR
jgi:hypothetical protein